MTPAVPDQQQGSNLIPGPRPPRLRGRQRSLLADPVHSRAYSLVGSAPTIVLRAADEAGRVAAEKKRTSIASSFASAGECEATCAGTDQLSASSTQDTTTQHETAAERSKRTERWWRVAAELRESERTYLDVLETIDELYYQPLLRMLPPLDPAGRLRRRASKRHSMPTWTSFSKLDSSPSVVVVPDTISPVSDGARPPNQQALSHVDVERIFSNFPDILTLSRLLVETLQGVFADEDLPDDDLTKSTSIAPSQLRLGRTLLPLLPSLKQYSVFLANYPAALQALAAVEREPSTDSQSGLRGVTSEQQQSWRSLVADARGKARQDPSRSSAINLNLSGLLLNIVQRVPRYRLLLAELIRFSDPETTDAADLRAAYKLVDGVATHLNDQIRQHEHDLRVLALQQRFERLAAPLLIPGRHLLKEANVQIYLQDIQGDQRCIFLFTDILLLARPRERVASPTLPKNTSTPLVEDLSISLADLTVAAGRERAFDSCASLDIFTADRAFSITTVLPDAQHFYSLASLDK
ncbi:hypothetical protein C6P46_005321 [Rhodotorula mucilaginosa]|uniref:DH domain-containing protein n=1 Tax=Rhodotorula mucilaginosa TaxID=5537 RepID=A0A9P6VZ07_RHOMI|nr:hypothetical protein C6P46_005321 [Rhodotorula mucilaginosa]